MEGKSTEDRGSQSSSQVIHPNSIYLYTRKLKQDISCGQDGLSVISEQTGFTKVTQAEKNLNKMENNRAKDLEKALKDLEETSAELASLKTKYKAAVARRDTLENQLKDFKGEVQQKMKILIEKTGNICYG